MNTLQQLTSAGRRVALKKMNILIFAACIAFVSAEESCHSFAGGNVYPRESIYSGAHELQVSKARSM